MDVVLVTVKTYDTQPAISSIMSCCHHATIFLTLQNGIGNGERVAELVGPAAVLLGTTAQGATYVEPGKIRHGGNGPTFIGEFTGPATQRVDALVNLFTRAGLVTQASDEMEGHIWRKLLINVGINAITALTGIRNGGVANLEAARDLSRTAVEEAMAVARPRAFQWRPIWCNRYWPWPGLRPRTVHPWARTWILANAPRSMPSTVRLPDLGRSWG